MEYRRFN